MKIVINCIKTAVFSTILASSSWAAAQTARDAQAYDALASFADRICKDAPLSSNSTKTELSAKAKAELNGFFKKLADLGLSPTSAV